MGLIKGQKKLCIDEYKVISKASVSFDDIGFDM